MGRPSTQGFESLFTEEEDVVVTKEAEKEEPGLDVVAFFSAFTANISFLLGELEDKGV